MANCCIIITTTDNLEVAVRISQSVIKQNLARCVHRDNIESTYEQEGEIVTCNEYRLTVKCTNTNAKAVMDFIKQQHNYTLPEVIKINIDDGSEEYLKWLIHY